jgi:hypothetical protein
MENTFITEESTILSDIKEKGWIYNCSTVARGSVTEKEKEKLM